MEGTHEVGRRPFMPASTLSRRSVALLRVNLDECTSEGRSISHGNCTRILKSLRVFSDIRPLLRKIFHSFWTGLTNSGWKVLIAKRSGSKYEAVKPSGAWIKVKLHQEQEFVVGGFTKPEGSRKHFGALLVGFFESRKLKFAGRVRTGFSDKLLSTLYSELSKIMIEKCPFYNLPAAGRNRWDQGLSAAEMKRCHW